MIQNKDLNTGEDNSRFMPASADKENTVAEEELHSELNTQSQSIKHSDHVEKEMFNNITSEAEKLATPVFLATEKITYRQEEEISSVPTEVLVTEQLHESEPNYENKYSSIPYQNYQNYKPLPTSNQQTNTFGIIGLVLAIFSWIILLVPIIAQLFWFLGLIFSIIGLFKKPRGLAIAGVVISLIGLVIGIMLITLLGFSGAFQTIQ